MLMMIIWYKTSLLMTIVITNAWMLIILRTILQVIHLTSPLISLTNLMPHGQTTSHIHPSSELDLSRSQNHYSTILRSRTLLSWKSDNSLRPHHPICTIHRMVHWSINMTTTHLCHTIVERILRNTRNFKLMKKWMSIKLNARLKLNRKNHWC